MRTHAMKAARIQGAGRTLFHPKTGCRGISTMSKYFGHFAPLECAVSPGTRIESRKRVNEKRGFLAFPEHAARASPGRKYWRNIGIYKDLRRQASPTVKDTTGADDRVWEACQRLHGRSLALQEEHTAPTQSIPNLSPKVKEVQQCGLKKLSHH